MTDDLKDILAAIDEINKPKHKKNKKLENKIDFEEKNKKIIVKKYLIKKEANYLSPEDNIPTITENFILEAEKHLKSIK
jgi:hypothetical protein